MFIKVRGMNPPHAGVWRAGRYFPANETVTLEVVAGTDPKAPAGKDGKPSMTQISQAGFEALKKDGRFNFQPDETLHAARDAAVDGARSRVRPILMTSAAMIAGIVPMALGVGEGGDQVAPLGRAVIGGLAAGTLTTLFVLPAIFALFMGAAGTASASVDPFGPTSPRHVPRAAPSTRETP